MLACCLSEVSFSGVVLALVTRRVKVFAVMRLSIAEVLWGVKSTTFGGRPVSELILVFEVVMRCDVAFLLVTEKFEMKSRYQPM